MTTKDWYRYLQWKAALWKLFYQYHLTKTKRPEYIINIIAKILFSGGVLVALISWG